VSLLNQEVVIIESLLNRRGSYYYFGICGLSFKCAQINLAGAEIEIILIGAYKQPVRQWLI
jgi:hypothetical protein